MPDIVFPIVFSIVICSKIFAPLPPPSGPFATDPFIIFRALWVIPVLMIWCSYLALALSFDDTGTRASINFVFGILVVVVAFGVARVFHD